MSYSQLLCWRASGVLGVALALLVPVAAVHAQEVLTDAGVAPPAPDPAAPSAPDPAAPSAPDHRPSAPTQPVPVPHPQPEPQPESVPQPAADKAAATVVPKSAPESTGARKRDQQGVVVGADFGLASGGSSTELFGSGLGSALNFGYRSGSFELNLRFAESYDLQSDPVLEGAIDGSFEPSSVVFSYWLSLFGEWRLGLGGGPAMVSSSMVASKDGLVTEVERKAVGVAMMLGASLPLGDRVNLVLSMHTYSLFWEHPSSTVIDDVEDEMVIRTVDPGESTPISLGGGFRVQF